MIAGSQTIAEDRTWLYLLRIAGSQTIANDRRSGFPYDRRRSQNSVRFTICDSRSSAIIWKPAFIKEKLERIKFMLWLRCLRPFLQNQYCRIRMVETFCSCAIQTYLWRSLGIDIIFTFLSALFRLNNYPHFL